MGWFTEDREELVPTGKVIAEERVTGSRLNELGKFALIIAFVVLLASPGDPDKESGKRPEPAPTVTVTVDPFRR